MIDQVVILAGGLGTRLGRLTETIPKPMVEIDGVPMILTIMRHFARYGVRRFVIGSGYRDVVIKGFFKDFMLSSKAVRFDLSSGEIFSSVEGQVDWEVLVVNTGVSTNTGRRVDLLREHLGGKAFFLTYGDGLSDVNLQLLCESHFNSGKALTLTGVKAPSRYGIVEYDSTNTVIAFNEKPSDTSEIINGGFMAVSNDVWKYFNGDDEMFETGPLERMVVSGDVNVFRHQGFWQCVDTPRDLEFVTELAREGLYLWGK